jgi:hypothetical protein
MEDDPENISGEGAEGAEGGEDVDGGGGEGAEDLEQSPTSEVVSLSIMLGDFIKVIAPTHQEIHEHTFLVDYLSSRKIRLVDIDTREPTILKLDATGNLTDESITSIELLDRAEEKGYARQNNLVVSTWVDIRFGGDIPTIITGMITNLEEDMIEIRTYPEDEMIYINFGYMGIPENLPIEEIRIRAPPSSFGAASEAATGEAAAGGEAGFLAMGMDAVVPPSSSSDAADLSPLEQRRRERQLARQKEQAGEDATEQPEGESEYTVLSGSGSASGSAASAALAPLPTSTIREKLRSILLDADQIQVGEELEVLVQTVDIPDENRRFNLEKQCDDLLDTLMSNVPAPEKSRSVLANIQRMVLRFRELRRNFSRFDANGNPTVPPPKSAAYRPLVESLMKMDQALRWIIPIVKTRKVIYDIPIDERTAAEMDVAPRLIQEEREAENELQRQWYDGSLTYAQYMTNLSARYFTPSTDPRYTHDVISARQVNENITAVIDNLDDFYSSVITGEEVKRRRFVIQKYNLGLAKVRPAIAGAATTAATDENSAILKRTTEFTNLTQNDRMNITGFMTFPEPVMRYSRITMPTINILDKCDLNAKHVHYWDMLRQMMTLTTHDIADLNTPLDLNAQGLLREIKQFVLEPAAGAGGAVAAAAAAPVSERDKYRKFLEVIIPKTRTIFEMMRQYIHGRLTLQDVLSFIEPFLIYQDDLNVKQYDEIVAFLYERVLEYKRNYATNFRKFGRLRSFHYNVRYMGVSMIYKLIVTGKMMDADVFKAYGFQDTQVRSAVAGAAAGAAAGGMDERQRQQMRGRSYAAGLSEQTDYNENLLSSSELLSRMLAVDYAKLYMDAVAITTTELITPFDFNLVLGEQSQKLRDAGAMRGGAPGGGAAAASAAIDAPKRFGMVLAKNYSNEEALQEDNDRDQPIFFDKKYDTTDYAFLESYRDQQESMSNTDFSMFLVDELIKNKKMTYEDAKKESEAILLGPGLRPVNDGDYAVVEIDEYVEPTTVDEDDLGTTETKFLYFKRDNGKWVRDTSIPEIIPSSDRNYFCNVDRDCIPFAVDATRNMMSELETMQGVSGAAGGGGAAASHHHHPHEAIAHITSQDGTTAIKKAFLDKMKAEFDVKYQVTRENFMEFVNKKFEYDLKNISRITEIQHKEFYKYNDRKYKIGFQAQPKTSGAGDDDDDADDDIDAIISPMEPLKDKIVAQTDFVKRQYDLMQFITSFTRKANEIMDEDPNWLYCIKSNAKLLPSFYETIAVAFIQGGGSGGGRASALSVVIDTICKERGTISDDGEAWVDKYSGALIKKIEHVTEEGFDDAGFRLVTRDIIEADLGEGVLKVAKPVAAGGAAGGAATGGGGLHGISILEKYDSPNARIINNIVTTMTGYMGIDLHAEREFIIQHTLTLLETAVPTEEKYRERSEKMFREKGKPLPPYKETFFQTLLLLTLCHLTVAIQCAIPTPKTRKTHAGCIRSFTGYPIDGDGDISGMMYIACIAYKIRTSIEPWNTLKSFKKEGDILAKMKLLLDASIITKQVIKERMQTKRDYLKSREGGAGGEAIPEELSIMRWGNYMPPMKSLDNMPTPQNVAGEFTNQLITDMKSGYHGQHDKLAVLESKSMYFSLSIQQMIHSVVKNSSPLLLNMASEPFLENACCNEPTDRRSKRVIDYFMEREQNIHHHNRIIGFLTKTARDMAVMTRATTIIDNRNTRYQYPNIPADFDEKTIYRAFIHYCRMNQQYTAAASASDAAESANPVATAVAMYLHPEIREICPPRPQDWNPTDIIETKISKLKKDSNIFDEKSLERLLKAVNRHKMVDADYKTAVRPQENTQFQRFQDAVLHLERCDAQRAAAAAAPEEQQSELDQCIIPRELRQLILAILQSGSPTMVQEDTQEMRDLKNYLQTKNRELRASVLGFIQQHAKQTKGKFREIERIVDTVLTFEINKSSTVLMSATDETAAKSIQFMRNTLTRLIDVIPNIIHNGVDFDDTNIPKHWGFSDTHMKDIKGIIASHYTSLKSFYNDHVIKEVLRHAEHHYRDLKLMVDNTPFMAEIFFDEEKDAKIAATAAALAVVQNQGLAGAAAAAREEPREVDVVKELGERVPHSTRKNIFTMYSVFDRSIVCNLNLFYFLSFMRTFPQLVAETPITMYQSEPTRVKRKAGTAATAAKATTPTKKGAKAAKTTAYALSSTPGAIARNANYREEEEAEEDEIDPHSRLYSSDAATAEKGQLLSDMDIVMGDKKALSQRVSELMVAYVRMIEKDKSAINFNLANIKEKLTRVKDKEKDGVVERIGAMSAGERQIENMMKTHKMGIWSRGTSQTGVVIYDQDYYDEERDEMEKIAQKERQLGRRDYVTDMNREIYVMDALEADRSAAEIEAHELDMSTGIPEDDDAGEDDAAFIHRHDDEGDAVDAGSGARGGGDWD